MCIVKGFYKNDVVMLNYLVHCCVVLPQLDGKL